MDFFEWDQNFETGIPDIDQQHHHLVKVTNEFGHLLSQNEVNLRDIEKVFRELVSYTQYHFEEEEALMVSAGIDKNHRQQHEQEHQSFLHEVTSMSEQMLMTNAGSGTYLFEFLINWLVFHIMGSDMSLARQMRAINAGQLPTEAYLAEEQVVDKATGLLLKSVKNLFQQVSNRNKQLGELNQTLEQKVKERTQSLFDANQKLGELAATDVLTGLSNRRHALQLLEQLWEESAEKALPLACMMIDADGFKVINDTFGHDAGDLVLCELAKQLKYAVRSDDIVCRLGGDEFLILCPNTGEDGVMLVAQQLQIQISELSVPVTGGAWSGSVSVGVAVRTGSMLNPENLIKLADLGVYAAKEAGRNCVKMVR